MARHSYYVSRLARVYMFFVGVLFGLCRAGYIRWTRGRSSPSAITTSNRRPIIAATKHSPEWGFSIRWCGGHNQNVVVGPYNICARPTCYCLESPNDSSMSRAITIRVHRSQTVVRLRTMRCAYAECTLQCIPPNADNNNKKSQHLMLGASAALLFGAKPAGHK